jgi:protein phosphatase
MLVCPQCQFENPDDHKFCQKCGTSLTEKTCLACETLVAFDQRQCPTCGEITGQIWRAIVTLVNNPASVNSPSIQLFSEVYLDAQHRYKLLEPLPAPAVTSGDVELSVIDCQPFQPSLLEAWTSNVYPEDQPLEAVALNSVYQSEVAKSEAAKSEAALEMPEIATLYLKLQQCSPALPQIHDAWQQNGQIVVLLQDRAELTPLLDFWSSEQVLPLQILHWLHEIAELWVTLQPHQCTQSLLEPNNLRVDEDHLLCLQRLYLDQMAEPLEFKALSKLWQQLFQNSQRTQPAALAQLYSDLETGVISTLDQLESRLEAIANEFQSEPNPSMSPLDFSNAVPISEANASTEKLPLGSDNPSIMTAVSDIPQNFPLLERGNPDEDAGGEGDDTPTVVLPMKLISLEEAGRTDIGRQRDHNEDYFSIQSDAKKLETPSGRSLQVKGLYILCDGMGGHAGGEVASALAVDTLRHYFETHWQDQLPKEESIREAIQLANRAIFDLNQQNGQSGSGRMGTTLVLVLVQNTEAAIAHVGDSRLYRFSRRRGLEQVTVDHEVGQREIQRGVEPSIAYARPDAYQLTQALGPRDENFINPDIEFLELNEDLLLMLCSDGLTDNDLLETHWSTHVEPLLSSQSNLEQGVGQLIELANQQNGHDNITAILIRAKVRPNLELLKQQQH